MVGVGNSEVLPATLRTLTDERIFSGMPAIFAIVAHAGLGVILS